MRLALAEDFISPTILQGFSDPEKVRADLLNIDGKLEREREWHAEAHRYATSAEILGAAAAGDMVQIVTDQNIKPAMRFLNPLLALKHPPYLLPFAADTLKLLGQTWRMVAESKGVHENIRLSVSSMARSQAYQNKIVAGEKLGVLDSTHVTGATFDLDLGGYHIVDYSYDRDAVVSLRDPDSQEKIADAFARDYGICDLEPVRLGPEWFESIVVDSLLIAANVLYEQGIINVVPEMVGDANTALHISARPPGIAQT